MAKSWVAGGVVVAAVLAVAGCGSNSHQASPGTPTTTSTTAASTTTTTLPHAVEPVGHIGDALAVSYRRTISAGSARISMRIDTSYRSGLRLPISASGEERWHGTLASITLHLPSVVATSFGSSVLAERYIGSVLYVELPKKAQALSEGKSWLGLTGFGLKSSSAFGQNPAEALEILEAQSSSVTKVGPATIDGVATTEYRASINLAKASATAPPALRSLLQTIEQHTVIHALPVTVYLDHEGRLREMVERETVNSGSASAATAGPAHTVVVLKLSDYGLAVHVAAPPRASTLLLPFSQFTKLLSGG